MIRTTVAILALGCAVNASAGIVAVSDTTGHTIALTTDECPGSPGWGVARLADGWTTMNRGCWQLGDNGAVITKFPPAWKENYVSMQTYRWVPNIQFTRAK